MCVMLMQEGHKRGIKRGIRGVRPHKKTINKNEVILMGEILKWLNIILNGKMMAARK